jgi:hypothetical protein
MFCSFLWQLNIRFHWWYNFKHRLKGSCGCLVRFVQNLLLGALWPPSSCNDIIGQFFSLDYKNIFMYDLWSFPVCLSNTKNVPWATYVVRCQHSSRNLNAIPLMIWFRTKDGKQVLDVGLVEISSQIRRSHPHDLFPSIQPSLATLLHRGL